MNSIAISPLDGRYRERVQALSEYLSEYALMKYRTLVECEYFILLSESQHTGVRKLKRQEVKIIRDIYLKFDESSFRKIKKIEVTTNHDVKSVEYYLKRSLIKTSLKDSTEWIHFGLTSEDTNNFAYAIILSLSVKKVLLPVLITILENINKNSHMYKDLSMLARTHGQSASPTTLGKEFFVFTSRLKRQINQLEKHSIMVKLNGATGNYNAFVAAYPKVNWPKFTKTYVYHINSITGLSLEPNYITTQIEPHDSFVELFDIIKRINTILIDLNQDIWRYISDGYLIQKPKPTEVGSSTMPHKINPIDFENSEGNLGIANALFEFYSRKLPISRLQRDLSDSTVERSFGTAFGHSYLAYKMLYKGLNKIEPSKTTIADDLLIHPEVISEAIQTILRREKYPIPYESLKKLTRGKNINILDFQIFIDQLKVSKNIKIELSKFKPENYTGLADKLVK